MKYRVGRAVARRGRPIAEIGSTRTRPAGLPLVRRRCPSNRIGSRSRRVILGDNDDDFFVPARTIPSRLLGLVFPACKQRPWWQSKSRRLRSALRTDRRARDGVARAITQEVRLYQTTAPVPFEVIVRRVSPTFATF